MRYNLIFNELSTVQPNPISRAQAQVRTGTLWEEGGSAVALISSDLRPKVSLTENLVPPHTPGRHQSVLIPGDRFPSNGKGM